MRGRREKHYLISASNLVAHDRQTADQMMQQATQQAVPQQAAAATPPGWYPDPVTGSGQRYWDGIEWSREFARPGPGQQVAPPQQLHQQQLVAPVAQPGLAKGITPISIAAVLFIWRVTDVAAYWEARELGALTGNDAYNQGVIVGSVFGFFLTGLLFSWGMNRYRSASASPTGEPADFNFAELAPLAFGIAVAGTAISYFLGTQ